MPTPLTRKPVRINVELSGALHHKLRMMTVDEGTNLQALVERLLRQALDMPAEGEQAEEGRKKGVRYGRGGSPAMALADHQR